MGAVIWGRGMDVKSIVIIGAGHAGAQVAASLREEGFTGALTLLSDEAEPPYQRPPLSKAFLKGEIDLSGLPLRGEGFFREHDIDLQARRQGVGHRSQRKASQSGERRKPALRPAHPRHRRASARVESPRRRLRKRAGAAHDPRRAVDSQLARAGQERCRRRRGLYRPRDRCDGAQAPRQGDDHRDRRPADGTRRFADHVGVLPRSAPGVRRLVPPRDRRRSNSRRRRPRESGRAFDGRASGRGRRHRRDRHPRRRRSRPGRGVEMRERHRRRRVDDDLRSRHLRHRRLLTVSQRDAWRSAEARIGAERHRSGQDRGHGDSSAKPRPTMRCRGSGATRATSSCRSPGSATASPSG